MNPINPHVKRKNKGRCFWHPVWVATLALSVNTMEKYMKLSSLSCTFVTCFQQKPAVNWCHRTAPGSEKIPTMKSGSTHMSGPVPGSASHRATESLSWPLPPPSQPSCSYFTSHSRHYHRSDVWHTTTTLSFPLWAKFWGSSNCLHPPREQPLQRDSARKPYYFRPASPASILPEQPEGPDQLINLGENTDTIPLTQPPLSAHYFIDSILYYRIFTERDKIAREPRGETA